MRKYINPWNMQIGAPIPNWLLKRSEVSLGEKVCYGRLRQYYGKNGKCYPKITQLAEELGISTPQIHRYIRGLKDHKLVETIRVGKKCTNRYKFLWHPWLSIFEQEDECTITSETVTSHIRDITPIKCDRFIEKVSKKEYQLKASKSAIASCISSFYTQKGYEDPTWCKQQYPRFVRSAIKLLELAQGEVTIAETNIEKAGAYFKSKGLDWTLDTVVKRWNEIKGPNIRYV